MIFNARGVVPYYLDRYFEQKNIKETTRRKILETLKKGKADFLSFSYYMSNISEYQGEPMKFTGLAS